METVNAQDDQVNEEKQPPQSRVCPRCNSENTKFCYFNNYNVSQPRYFCKNCRRYWTHGGALRNIPIGGSCRKPKRSKADQASSSQVAQLPQVISVDHIQQVQPYINVQRNEFLGSFGGSQISQLPQVLSVDHIQQVQPYMNVQGNEFLGHFGGGSSSSVMNHFGSMPELHGGMMTNMTPHQTLPPVDHRFDFAADGSFQHYFNVGSNELVGNPVMNQPIAGNFENPNNFQGFHNPMNMNYHNSAGASGSSGPSGVEMNRNNNNNNNLNRNSYVFRSSHPFEKHGP